MVALICAGCGVRSVQNNTKLALFTQEEVKVSHLLGMLQMKFVFGLDGTKSEEGNQF